MTDVLAPIYVVTQMGHILVVLPKNAQQMQRLLEAAVALEPIER